MNSISVLIIEDEILIADTIKRYLLKRGHSVQGIAISYEEAVEAYNQKKPDVILLDIRLFGTKTGIDFGRFLQEQDDPTPFVFLTSQYDKSIVDQAIMFNPSGFLIKPITKESLWTTVESAAQKRLPKYRITDINDGKTSHKIKTQDILYMKSDHVYVQVHTVFNKIITTRSTLQKLLEQINSELLLPCHRSYIINMNHVTTWSKNEIILKDEISIPISRSRRNSVISQLG